MTWGIYQQQLIGSISHSVPTAVECPCVDSSAVIDTASSVARNGSSRQRTALIGS